MGKGIENAQKYTTKDGSGKRLRGKGGGEASKGNQEGHARRMYIMSDITYTLELVFDTFCAKPVHLRRGWF